MKDKLNNFFDAAKKQVDQAVVEVTEAVNSGINKVKDFQDKNKLSKALEGLFLAGGKEFKLFRTARPPIAIKGVLDTSAGTIAMYGEVLDLADGYFTDEKGNKYIIVDVLSGQRKMIIHQDKEQEVAYTVAVYKLILA